MIKKNIYKLLRVIYRLSLTKKIFAFSAYLLSLNPLARTHCTGKTLRCSTDIFNKNYQYYRIGRDTPACCATHLYELLKDISECLENNNIEYFIFYGTHLGAIRHNGLIPWDTDIDLCIMESNRDVAIKIMTNYCSSSQYDLKVEDSELLRINFSDKNKSHVDVYFTSISNKFIYLKGYERYQFPESSIFPLKTLSFCDLQVNAPNSLEPLYIQYGKDCLSQSFYQYSLVNKESIKKFIPAKIDSCYLKK